MDWSVRAYRALLTLYPADFRDEYGREIALVFCDAYRSAATRGERARLWAEALYGVLTEAPKEHLRMILQDVQYAVRGLRNNPGFAAATVLALALGIGANSAVFSVVNAVVLRTLPVSSPEHLYLVTQPARKPSVLVASWPQFQRLRDAAKGDGQIAAMSRVARMHARPGSATESETIGVQLISGEYFDVLGVPALRGRLINSDDNRAPGAHPVAVISHGWWQRRFGSAPDAVGKEVTINGVRFTIVGIAQAGFSGVSLEEPADAWLPLAMQSDVRYSQNYSADGAKTTQPWMPQDRIWWLNVIVHAPGGPKSAFAATLDVAYRQELERAAESTADPEERRRLIIQRRIALAPFGNGVSMLRERFAKPLYVLLAMAALVLLIACANTANLMLARAEGRQREIAVRLSLGAGRVRLLRQLFTESLLLVLIASAAALAVARWTAEALVRMATATSTGPAPFTPQIDGRVLGFTAAMALLTAILFGFAPALRASKVDVADALKSGARNISGSAAGRMHRVLVVFQVALSLVLVVGTGLLVQTLRNVLRIPLGFEREHVLSVTIDPRLAGYKGEQFPAVYQRLLDGVRGVPGVRSAGLAMCGILASCRSVESGMKVEGYGNRPGENTSVSTNFVSRQYFESVGMRLVSGRAPDERDRKGGPSVAVVNQSFVRRYLSGTEPLGKRFGYELNHQIVGVVEDARVLHVRQEPMPMAFFSLEQHPAFPRAIEIRTAGDPAQVASSVRRAIREAAPSLPVESVATLSERVSNNLSYDRLLISLTSVFGALALGLAAFGLFGLLSYAVSRRSAEFGIRLALGAPRSTVLRSVLREAVLLAGAGAAVGLPLVAAGSRVIRSLLFGVDAWDAATIAGAVAVLTAVAALAGLLPAWRASRVDPLMALRSE